WSVATLIVAAATNFAAATANQPPTGRRNAAVYAGVGEELIAFAADIEQLTLTRQASVALPGFVQEAWTSSSGPFLYVAWSNGGTSYSGSGVAPRGDQHGITAFRVDPAGGLHVHGMPAPLRARPIHITGDRSARHLLVAFNDPSGVAVYTINPD